jgi:hypothetical protein
MGLVYLKRTEENKKDIANEKTFGEFIDAIAKETKPIFKYFNELPTKEKKMEELALYNWCTKNVSAIKRILLEQYECSSIKDIFDSNKNSLTHILDFKIEPARIKNKTLYIPALLNSIPPVLTAEKVNTINLLKRFPTPGVSIGSLTTWFDPDGASPGNELKIKIHLEGSAEIADKAIFEVHTDHYYLNVNKTVDIEVIESKDKNDPSKMGNPTIKEIEKQKYISTKASEPSCTCIHQDALAIDYSNAIDKNWNGVCEIPDQGILSGNAKINSGCAPYIALVRLYKNDSDKDIKIILKNFSPFWKPTELHFVDAGGPNTSGEPEAASLMAKWVVIGNKDKKLKIGQLQVWDKDQIIHVHPLAESDLTNGEHSVDLSTLKSTLKSENAPFRIQIQARSGEDARNEGLSIAVMHTVVKARMYTSAQMVGFNIKSISGYYGEPKDIDDINCRCDILKKGIEDAHTQVAIGSIADSAEKLKVFMAPEFFFRGINGAYLLSPSDEDALKPNPYGKGENVTSYIMKKMSEETNKFKYADWLFVFGTAIGYQPHYDKSGGSKKDIKYEVFEVISMPSIPDPGNKKALLLTVTNQSDVLKEFITDYPEIKSKCKFRLYKIGPDDKATCVVETKINNITFVSDKNYSISVDNEVNETIELKMYSSIVFPTGWVESVSSSSNEIIVASLSNVFDKIPETDCAGSSPLGWTIKQNDGGTVHKFTTGMSEKLKSPVKLYNRYKIKVDNSASMHDKEGIAIKEFQSAEIFNIALVKKGWPAELHDVKVAKDNNFQYLNSALIYKEYVSAIDFEGITSSTWYDKSKDHTISLKSNTIVSIPVYGSRDTLGASPQTSNSEINKSGLGGGSVFTIDGITFGVEVCLDHGNDRLFRFYNDSYKCSNCNTVSSYKKQNGACPMCNKTGTSVTNSLLAKAGEPKVQVQLIPSWGMKIEWGLINTVPNGLVLNVDGQETSPYYEAAFRLNNTATKYLCTDPDHTTLHSADGFCSVQMSKCPNCFLEWITSTSSFCPNCSYGLLTSNYIGCKNCRAVYGTCACPPPRLPWVYWGCPSHPARVQPINPSTCGCSAPINCAYLGCHLCGAGAACACVGRTDVFLRVCSANHISMVPPAFSMMPATICPDCDAATIKSPCNKKMIPFGTTQPVNGALSKAISLNSINCFGILSGKIELFDSVNLPRAADCP